MMDLTKPRMLMLKKTQPEAGLGGYLGVEELTLMDVEVDLKHNKINFFSPDHCKGPVVYWSDAAVVLPIKFDPSGSMYVNMGLDGQTMRTNFTPERSHGRMIMATLKDIFHRTPDDLGSIGMVDGERVYRYPFKSLSAEGLSIGNPDIDIFDTGAKRRCDAKLHWDGGWPSACFGAMDLSLGLSELRALRLYFAFDEKRLYITAADAHR